MADASYELMEPFDIDNGELNGIRPQIVFCLGYEWCQLRTMLEGDEPISKTIHTENASRVKRMCIRRNRKCKVEPVRGMEAEWCFLEVAGIDGEFVEHG